MDQPNPLPPAVMGYGKYEQRCRSGCLIGYGGQGQGMAERGASLTFRWHSKDRDEVYRKAVELRPPRFAILYTGKIPKDAAVVL